MTLTVRLPETIESQLTRFCEVLGLSKSQVVQSALKDWFAKPASSQQHPLLVFAQASVNAAPSDDWPGAYSKDRLRQQVLASGAKYLASELQTPYNVSRTEPARIAAKRVNKKVPRRSTPKAIQPTQNPLS